MLRGIGRLRSGPIVRNLLTNSAFSGAVAGTPGTPPTSWTYPVNGGTLGVSGTTLTTSTAAAARHFISSASISIQANASCTVSVEITAVSVAGAAENIATLNVTAGSVSGVSTLSSSAGIGRKSFTFTAGAGGATFSLRIGAGVTVATTGATSVSFKEPMLNYGDAALAYVAT